VSGQLDDDELRRRIDVHVLSNNPFISKVPSRSWGIHHWLWSE
jgi:hypothetical protein